MALFEEVFNKASIYDMLFFNVKAVLQHPTLKDLEANNKLMFERWEYLSKTKYGFNDISEGALNKYLLHAPYYPEFCKIIAISFASVYTENNQLKRDIKKFAGEDEAVLIETLMSEFTLLSNATNKLNPPFFPPLCGHNVISYDIPLLIKRFLLYGENFKSNKQLPLILKRTLDSKPWESNIVDTVNVWKFNGNDYMTLMLIADYLGLKKTIDLLPHNELSEYYWEHIDEKPKETLDFIALQSATETNLVIQLMNKLRQF